MIVEISVIVLCGVILSYYWLFYADYQSYYGFPKRIWTYLPPIQNTNRSAEEERMLCIHQWKRDHPDMEVNVLTRENCQGYLRIPSALLNHPILNEDSERWMRLLEFFALTEHGGLWMDSTMMTHGDIRTWVAEKHTDLVAFESTDLHEKENKRPSVDPSWIACQRGHPFIEAWKQEWLKLLEYPSAEEYVEARRSWGVSLPDNPIGNTTEVALQTMYQFHPPSMERLLIRPKQDATRYGLRRLSTSEKKELAHQMVDAIPVSPANKDSS